MTGFETRLIHAGQDPDATTGAVVPPIHLATTYAQDGVGQHRGFEYSRSGNPTRQTLETCLASLESAQHGFAFASGLAAEDCLLRTLAPGATVVVPPDAYGGTYRLIARVHGTTGALQFTTDWPERADVVWVESPSNPMLQVVDLAEMARRAHAIGALLVVDNTFATPYYQRPLELGADVVIHSATKYLGGHSDVVGGALVCNDDTLAEKVGFLQNAVGAVPAPFDCYMLLRGIKTLAVRMDRHTANARAVAAMLETHSAVAKVLYPGFGGMVSFIASGGEEAALRVAEGTKLFTLAESLGAVESLIEHPARMTHASVADSPLAVDPALVRLSVGIETIDDLIADLRHALDSI